MYVCVCVYVCVFVLTSVELQYTESCTVITTARTLMQSLKQHRIGYQHNYLDPVCQGHDARSLRKETVHHTACDGMRTRMGHSWTTARHHNTPGVYDYYSTVGYGLNWGAKQHVACEIRESFAGGLFALLSV